MVRQCIVSSSKYLSKPKISQAVEIKINIAPTLNDLHFSIGGRWTTQYLKYSKAKLR